MAFFGVNFILQKFCPCKKNDKSQVWINHFVGKIWKCMKMNVLVEMSDEFQKWPSHTASKIKKITIYFILGPYLKHFLARTSIHVIHPNFGKFCKFRKNMRRKFHRQRKNVMPRRGISFIICLRSDAVIDVATVGQ